MDRRFIELYDEYTHAPLPRRVFMKRLSAMAGGSAAAMALLPMLENNYAHAQLVPAADARIRGERIAYPGGSGAVKAYLATPAAGAARRGAVIVVHENRGLNPHIEDVARRAALDGFTALAPDLLSALGGTPASEDAAREMFAKLDMATALRDLVPAVAWLKGRPDALGPVGAVGFCWGGGAVNQLAVRAPDLAAAVPFYGAVPAASDVPHIKARMLLHYAGNDARINAGIPGYEAAMKAAGVSYRIHVYDGVEHAFHNDTAGVRYNKAAAELAWARTIAFFKENLKA